MNESIFAIYKYAQLIPGIKDIISYSYSQDVRKIKENWPELAALITEYCSELSSVNMPLASKIMDKVSDACANTTGEVSNYNLMGDMLTEVIPLLEEAMSLFSSIDVTEKEYRLLSSKSGFLALMNTSTNRCYHSLVDPMSEAHKLAKRFYQPAYTEFHIAGCGLGYLPLALHYLSDMSVDIYIYHTSETLIQYAIDYGVLSWIPEANLHITINSEKNLLSTLGNIAFDDGTRGLVVLDDFKDLVTKQNLDSLLRYAIPTNTNADFSEILDINLWQNVANIKDTIYEAKEKYHASDWLVVVAGPSLDSKLDYIKLQQGTAKIVCASTVYKKLLAHGITPDFVCACDPQSRTFNHFEGVDSCDSVLLLEACANWRFSKYYGGAKYLVPCLTSMTSINYFVSKGYKPLYITGSVSYMCVLMAHFMGAKTIHLIGMDLAYPNGQSHASGTMDAHKVSDDGLFMVPSASGGEVATSRQFKFYIDTMNELFTSLKNVKIINHSDIGAAFENTVWYKNTEC